MQIRSFTAAAIGCAAAALALSACNREATRPARTDASVATSGSLGEDTAGAQRQARRGGDSFGNRAPIDTSGIDASVKWASNRKFTAQENVARQFRRNGPDFGAADANDYAAKASAFVGHPPAGTKTAVRGTGDKLFYDAASNTFAVMNRRGLPKTMFKPRDGGAYWTQQLATLNDFGKGRRNRQARNTDTGSDDNG
jgi:pyocin large subunit-like protein